MMKFMQPYGIVMHRTIEDISVEIKQQQKSFKVVYIGQQSSKIRMHLLNHVTNVKELGMFGVPRTLISDGGSHFCNKYLEQLLHSYGHPIILKPVDKWKFQTENSGESWKK
ncbi:hypothetical protein PIB30_090785 [Stylosanthes scabra]|uniref:Integrase catalytic domain-containing protein n=1 Tax=Stylosanthes scabra TaxID=79078 RepID=A0ABU6VUQ9_9FABA|nr:hypothetical protein [Stylosanthes scabra]